MASYNPPTTNTPIFDSTAFTDAQNDTTGETLAPLTPSPAGTYQSVQNVSIDQYGRTTAVETGISGTYLANGQHQPYNPLPQIPMLTGGWNNIIQTSIITDNWFFTTYADHNTLSIQINNVSSYTRYDYFVVRLTWTAFWSYGGTSPFPFNNVDSGSWDVVVFPSNMVNLQTTSGGAIPAPNSMSSIGFFDLDTNQYLTNWTSGVGGTYNATMGLGITYPTPNPIYAPTGRAFWCINPTNQGGTANFHHTLYPTQVAVNDTSIITFQYYNSIAYSGIAVQYSSTCSAELIAGGRWTDTISFIA